MVSINIMNSIHNSPGAKGSPSLFLLIAPPSVGVVAADVLLRDPVGSSDFNGMATILLGWCLGIFLLLIKLGPKIMMEPPALGAYWAYVFPVSALATACVHMATVDDTVANEVLALILVVLALFAVIVVFARFAFHWIQVLRGMAEWKDPLLHKEVMAAFNRMGYAELEAERHTA